MKILSKNFTKGFRGKIINIHPSLFPKYKDLNTNKREIKNKLRNLRFKERIEFMLSL